MADEKREVNFEEEIKVNIPDSEPEEGTDEEIDDSSDEKETQEDSSPQENQEDMSGKADEESSDENIQKSDNSSDIPVEPKPVEGETLREKALRLETQRLRRDLRETRNQKVFEGYKPEVKESLSEEEKAILSQYDEKELTQFEKIIDVLAKKKGWQKKEDFVAQTYQQQASDVLDNWLEQHKEYLPENDKDNTLWNQFQTELRLYQKPTNPRDLKRVFDRVHREVFGITAGIDNSKLNAQKEKVKTASHSGANQKSQIVRQTQGDPNLRQYLKGFSEEEKDEIIG